MQAVIHVYMQQCHPLTVLCLRFHRRRRKRWRIEATVFLLSYESPGSHYRGTTKAGTSISSPEGGRRGAKGRWRCSLSIDWLANCLRLLPILLLSMPSVSLWLLLMWLLSVYRLSIRPRFIYLLSIWQLFVQLLPVHLRSVRLRSVWLLLLLLVWGCRHTHTHTHTEREREKPQIPDRVEQ